MENLFHYLENTAAGRGSQTAFIERRRYRRIEWSYEQILQVSARIATLLEYGHLRKGDRVVICGTNSPLWVAAFLACAKLGVIAVPLDLNSTPDFIDSVLKQTSPKLCFTSLFKQSFFPTNAMVVPLEELPSLISGLPRHTTTIATEPDDLLEIVYTSGSTGTPKGVMLSHGNILSDITSLRQAWEIGNDYRLLSTLPLSHMFEQTLGLFVPFACGSPVIYPISVRPVEIRRSLRLERPTTMVTVPAFLELMQHRIVQEASEQGRSKQLERALHLAGRLPRSFRRRLFHGIHRSLGGRLIFFTVAGAPLPTEVEDFWERLGIHVLQGYGMTESSPAVTSSSLLFYQAGTVGRPLPEQELTLAEGGEIQLKGSHIFKGYWQNPEATAATLTPEGWFKTGDIGELGSDGYLRLKGRIKTMIITSSGMKVHPEDIEKLLNGLSTVRDSVVTGIERHGEIQLVATVISVGQPDLKEMAVTLNGRLASHQTLREIIPWPDEDFPRTTTRKVRREEIRKRLEQSHDDKTLAHSDTGKDVSALFLILSRVCSVAPDTLADSQLLVADLGLDSIKRLELLSQIEEDLGTVLSEDELDQTTSVGQLANLVKVGKAAELSGQPIVLWPLSWGIGFIRVILRVPIVVFVWYYQRLQVRLVGEMPQQPSIFVANHTSHFDTPTVLRSLPFGISDHLATAAAKDYFFKTRIRSFWARLLFNAFPVDRDGNAGSSIAAMGAFLDRGYSVLIYPEGTRSTTGRLGAFKHGIGLAALELGGPIVPIKMQGNQNLLPKGSHWPKKGTTTVTIGSPVTLSRTLSYIQATEAIQKMVEEL
ncbi:MAG: AMP-binding protein [bacterium]